MITMEMFGKIRRMHLRDKLSLHEITKRTGLSRNTLRKWLRMPEEAATPTYRRNEVPGKLAAYHETLVLALKADAHQQFSFQKRSGGRLHDSYSIISLMPL